MPSQAREKDEDVKRTRLRTTWVKVQKRRPGAALLFLDESGFRLLPFVGKTGSPVGETPTLVPSFGRWEKLSVVSGVAVRGRDVVDFLRQAGRPIRGRVIGVWDHRGQHPSPALRSSFDGPGRFEAVPLPRYCPERNPDEGVGSWVKSKDLAKRCPRDNEDFVDRARGSLGEDATQDRPRLRLLEGRRATMGFATHPMWESFVPPVGYVHRALSLRVGKPSRPLPSGVRKLP